MNSTQIFDTFSKEFEARFAKDDGTLLPGDVARLHVMEDIAAAQEDGDTRFNQLCDLATLTEQLEVNDATDAVEAERLKAFGVGFNARWGGDFVIDPCTDLMYGFYKEELD